MIWELYPKFLLFGQLQCFGTQVNFICWSPPDLDACIYSYMQCWIPRSLKADATIIDAYRVHFQGPPAWAYVYGDDDSVDSSVVHCQNQREKSSSEIDCLSRMVLLTSTFPPPPLPKYASERATETQPHPLDQASEGDDHPTIVLGTRNCCHCQTPTWEE